MRRVFIFFFALVDSDQDQEHREKFFKTVNTMHSPERVLHTTALFLLFFGFRLVDQSDRQPHPKKDMGAKKSVFYCPSSFLFFCPLASQSPEFAIGQSNNRRAYGFSLGQPIPSRRNIALWDDDAMEWM